jgi:hypothetical protein
VAWRRAAGPFVEHAPLVTAEGDLVVFSGRGDLVELAADGAEKRRVVVGNGPLGPGAILADGTIVTMTTNGEAVGIRADAQTAHVRFRTRVGDRGMLVSVAPLALDDGGVVVANAVRTSSHGGEPANVAPALLAGPAAGGAWQSEMAVLDADGHIRAKAMVPLAIVWPLVATKRGVAGISADGTVFVWLASGVGGDPVRVGSFAGGLDGGAAALDGSTLVAVVDAKAVVALDLEKGDTKVLLASSSGVILGPPSVGGGTVWVLEATSTGTRLVALDSQGGVMPFPLSGGASGARLEPDGGIAAVQAPIHTATLVDAAGRVAYAGPDGHVGVLSRSGAVDLGESLSICGRGAPPTGTRGTRPSAGFAGLTPTHPGSFLVACESGTLLEVTGQP